jgi:RES domain-containing protein
MEAYRIVQRKARATDISGTGSFRVGGRWNSKGTYMLYTSENSSLAYLEALVHFDQSLSPPQLFITQIEIDDKSPILTLPEAGYPTNWEKVGSIETQQLGDRLMKDLNYLGIRVRSAINTREFNILLNPLFPDYMNLVKVIDVTELAIDPRLKS